MNMNMKNEKTMLALIVVAALAMVSVAGVALASDQSDAASTTWDINSGAGNTVPAGFTQNIFIYEESSDNWNAKVVIPSDVTYSGTISIGYRDGDGTATSPYVYTAVSSITLTDASDVKISSYDGLDDEETSAAYYLLVTNTDGITIDVTKGTLYVDIPDGTPIDSAFTGTITAADLTVTAVNTGGFNVTYGTVATFAGDVEAGVEPRTWNEGDDAYSTVTLSGVGYYKDTAVGAKAALIVGDGSTISNDISSITGDVTLTGVSTDVWKDAKTYLIGQDGTMYSGEAGTGDYTGTIKFTDVNLGQSYNLFAFVDSSGTPSSSTHYVYYGAVSITASTTTAGQYNVTLGTNLITGTSDAVDNLSEVIANQITKLGTNMSVGTELTVADPLSAPDVGEIGAENAGTVFKYLNTYHVYYAVDLTTSEASFGDEVPGETYNALPLTSGADDNLVYIVLEDVSGGLHHFFGTITISEEGVMTALTNGNFTDASVNNDGAVSATGGISYLANSLKTFSTYTDDTIIFINDITTNVVVRGATLGTDIQNNDKVLVIFKDDAGTPNYYYYFGQVSASVTSSSAITGLTSFSTSNLTLAEKTASPAANEIGYSGSKILYNKVYCDFYYAYDVTNSASLTGSVAGEITGVSNNSIVLVILKNTSGVYYYYLGTIAMNTDGDITGYESEDISSASVGNTTASGRIAAAESNGKTLNLYSSDVSVLTVYGSLPGVNHAEYTGTAVFSDDVANGDSAIVLYKNADSSKYYIYIGTLKTAATATDYGVGFDCSTDKAITYNSTTMQFISAYNFTQDCAGTMSSTGIVSFDKMGDNDTILALFTNSSKYYYFYGEVSYSSTDKQVTSIVKSDGSYSLGMATIVSESPATGEILKTATPNASKPAASIDNNGLITVDGTINLYFVNETVNGSIDNTTGVIYVNGVIAYQVSTAGTAPLSNSTGAVNAVCYKVAGEGTISPTTYYYSSLATAMTESSDYTVYGTVKVLADTEITGKSETLNKITVPVGSRIIVGDTDDEITVDLTLPKTTTMYLYGNIVVADGKFVTDVSVMDQANVIADVLIKTADAKTYTDVVTALDMSVDGDTLTLRQDATFGKDAEVKDGVILDGANLYSIVVGAGTTFTVSDGSTVKGIKDVTVNAKTSTKNAGQLVMDTEKFTYIGTFALKGGLTFGTNYDNTASSIAAFGVITAYNGTTATPVTITVNGAVKFGQPIALGSDLCIVKFTDAGKVIANANLFSNVTDKVYISGTFTANVASMTMNDVTLTGTGSIVNGYDSTIVTISGHFVSGTPVTTLSSATNSTAAKVTLASGALAQVYGTYDSTKIVFAAAEDTQELNATAYYITEEIVYATFTQCVPVLTGTTAVEIADIAEPVITSYVFQNWYTSVNYNKVVTDENLGDYSKVYGLFTVKTVMVSVGPVVNGHWVINDKTYTDGKVNLLLSGNSISFVADSGYKVDGTVTVFVNDKEMPADYQPAAGDKLSVTANIVKDESVGGMDLVTMLLIVITIVIVIMAIIIALKLMRS